MIIPTAYWLVLFILWNQAKDVCTNDHPPNSQKEFYIVQQKNVDPLITSFTVIVTAHWLTKESFIQLHKPARTLNLFYFKIYNWFFSQLMNIKKLLFWWTYWFLPFMSSFTCKLSIIINFWEPFFFPRQPFQCCRKLTCVGQLKCLYISSYYQYL